MMKMNTKNLGVLALLTVLVITVVLISGCVGPAEKTGPGGIAVPSGFTKLPLIKQEYEGVTMTQYMGSGTVADAASSFKSAFQAAGWTFMGEGIVAAGYTGTGFEKGDEIAVIYTIQAEDQVMVMVIVGPKEVEEVPEQTYLESLVGTTWRGSMSGQFNGEYVWHTAIDNVEFLWEIEQVELTADMYIDKLYLEGPAIVQFSALENEIIEVTEPYSVQKTWYSDVSPEVWPIQITAYLSEGDNNSFRFEWDGRSESEGTYTWFVIVNIATTPPFSPEWVTWEDKYIINNFFAAPEYNRMPVDPPSGPRRGDGHLPPIAEATINGDVMHIFFNSTVFIIDGMIIPYNISPEGGIVWSPDHWTYEVLYEGISLEEIWPRGYLHYEGTFTKVTGGTH
jgi:hypothetical protein